LGEAQQFLVAGGTGEIGKELGDALSAGFGFEGKGGEEPGFDGIANR
jgi:hypothetical protein